MVFKDWAHMAQRPDARSLHARCSELRLEGAGRQANSHMTTPLDSLGGGGGATVSEGGGGEAQT